MRGRLAVLTETTQSMIKTIIGYALAKIIKFHPLCTDPSETMQNAQSVKTITSAPSTKKNKQLPLLKYSSLLKRFDRLMKKNYTLLNTNQKGKHIMRMNMDAKIKQT